MSRQALYYGAASPAIKKNIFFGTGSKLPTLVLEFVILLLQPPREL
jgi:hypothetical protein